MQNSREKDFSEKKYVEVHDLFRMIDIKCINPFITSIANECVDYKDIDGSDPKILSAVLLTAIARVSFNLYRLYFTIFNFNNVNDRQIDIVQTVNSQIIEKVSNYDFNEDN